MAAPVTYPLPDYFKKGLQVSEVLIANLLPMANIAAIFLPQIAAPVGIANVVAANLPNMMATAERLMGPGTGEQKVQYVMESAASALTILGGVSTGGQKETVAKIGPAVTAGVGLFMAMINSFREIAAGTYAPAGVEIIHQDPAKISP